MKKMEEEDPEEVAQRRGNILRAWAQLGRPGAAKVVQYMRKQGTPVSEKQVLAVLNEQTSQQVFRAPWKSEGFITASEKGDVWQIDIADNSHRSASANNGYKYFYVIVDVFTREVAAVPARVKTPQMSVEALVVAERRLGGFPKIVETDGGGEFKSNFEDFCRTRDIHHITREDWPNVR